MYTIKLTPQEAEGIFHTLQWYIKDQAEVHFLSDLNENQKKLFKAELHVIKEITKETTNEITFEQFRVLNLAMDIMKRDDRRPNGDSWFDAISELEHQGTLTKKSCHS